MASQKADIEALLNEDRTIQIFPQGYSMYPMFVPGRDEAVIAKADFEKLRRGDVVLYRRTEGILVLHRLCKKGKDCFFAVGDNQYLVEGPLRMDQIKGKLVGFVRKGHYISTANPIYLAAAHLWLFMRPVRGPIMTAGASVKRFFKKRLHFFP